MKPDQRFLEFFYDPLRYEQGAPLSELNQLRERAGVIWVDENELSQWPGGNGFWLVLGHSDCVHVLKNAKLFSSSLGGTQLRDPATPDDLAYVQRMMLNMDPPQHTRLRRLLINAFTSSAVARLEEQICNHAKAIIDKVIGDASEGECDFVRDIASDMPLLCLADIFGLPQQDRYLMFDWANRVIGYQDPDYASSNAFDQRGGSDIAKKALKQRPKPDANGKMPDPRSRNGMNDLYHYAHLLAEYKRGQPGADVVSILLAQVDDDGGCVSIEEFENMFWLFAVAGNETLRNGIPGGMIALLENPHAWQSLQGDPGLIPGAVEEMLRWWTPVMNFRRTATRDTELGGVKIGPGEKVVVSLLSANYDARVFERPERFDIQRTQNPHLSFGYGPHFCLGAQLAVSQMRAIFGELTRRFESIEATSPPRYLRSNFQRGVKSLPIRWRARI